MNDRKRKVRDLFDRAFEIESQIERSRFLDRACHGDQVLRADVCALLDAHAGAGSFLDAPPNEVQVTEVTSGPLEGPGAQIGPYKLLQKVGEGGFGIVYMAQQTEPIRRKVALKIIKQGMDTQQVIARFEAERQALAMMDHPNIAKVLDAGATETGRPYFVMELVRGDPITRYSDTARLDTEERLRLFMDVCHAVQHAHQKGVIHRDIKPSNVMVTLHDGNPVPKVIDFGIAKATQQDLTDKTLFTEYRQFIGTPAYMSPEQAEMSGLGVDTRSDIYSLGVLLYELLTGTTPFGAAQFRRAAIDEIVRMIRQDEPPRPSVRLNTLAATKRSQAKPPSEKAAEVSGGTSSIEEIARSRHADPASLAKSLSGDLDWIVMKTLEKDRSRRYDTAIQLANDVQRHLQYEPVLASPPSAVYRIRKYIRRNRGFVIAITAVSASLIVGIAALGVGLAEARRAVVEANLSRDRAQQAEDELRDAELRFTKEYFFTNLWRGDFQAAEDMLGRTQEFGASGLWMQNARAMLSQFQGDSATARDELDQVLKSSPENTLALALQSMVDYWDGDEIAWMDTVAELQDRDLGELSYDEKLIVAYASALPYPDQSLKILAELEADHRNYPVVRLVRAMAQRYLAMFSDDLDESRNLLSAALDDLKLVEGSLGDSPLAFQALITVNLQARDVWRALAASDADSSRELVDQASDFEQAAVEYADEAVRRFPSNFEPMWACAIAYQETDDDEGFARLIKRANLPQSHPLWNHICALYRLRHGDHDEAGRMLKKAEVHPNAPLTKFMKHWLQICDARANDATFRDRLKNDVIQYIEAKIASEKGAYLFIDLSTLLMLGERDEVKRLATRAQEEINDASMEWFEPIYDSLEQLDFEAASLKNRWSTYPTDEGPKLALAYIHFHAACDALGREDRTSARASFQACVDQGVFFIWIHWASRAFLARMDAGWPEWIEAPAYGESPDQPTDHS